MALRARLIAPPAPPRTVWKYHSLQSLPVSVDAIFGGDRRMEAAAYLSTGRGIRVAIEAKAKGWCRLGDIAAVTQPGRLKGILVSAEHGTPFLAATQVFSIRPIPRKFLALEQMATASECFVQDGTILVTRSGLVGRPIVANAPHRGVVLSDDLLRVASRSERDYGWIYAFLHSRQARAMNTTSQYGHIIKHLEVAHLDDLPIPHVSDKQADQFNKSVRSIIQKRDKGYQLTLEAEALFSEALADPGVDRTAESGFTVKSSAILGGRRRIDAAVHNPLVARIRAILDKRGTGFTRLADAGYDLWVPGRYKRIPSPDGVVYRDSADLLEVNPDLSKRFADCRFGDDFGGRVRSGWVLMPSSGQVYGIIGIAVLATAALDNQVVSNHVLRIAPGASPMMRTGYLVTALSHITLGLPLVKSLAFGSSVPEIDRSDLGNVEIVRLKPSVEDAIADLAEEAAESRATADVLEADIAEQATEIVTAFAAGHRLKCSSNEPQQLARGVLDAIAPDA